MVLLDPPPELPQSFMDELKQQVIIDIEVTKTPPLFTHVAPYRWFFQEKVCKAITFSHKTFGK